MKAAFIARENRVELRDLPIPEVEKDEMLVRMRVCGICGTDLEKVHGQHITPPVLGHEVAGVIEEIGTSVENFKKGERITVHHHISCRNCFYCKNGLETLCDAYPKSNLEPCGFAEYFRVSETLVKGGTVYRLPSSMSFEDGSQVEPTACCIRALRKSGIGPGNSAAVFGVGPVGLIHVELLKLYGAAPIFAIDPIEHRRRIAIKNGADFALDPMKDDIRSQMPNSTDGRGVDYSVVATSSPRAIEQALSSIRKGGKVVLFGAPARGALLSLDASRMFIQEIRLESSYSTSETEMRIALDLIERHRVRPSSLITHRLPLEQISEAFRLAETGENVIKVIVQSS